MRRIDRIFTALLIICTPILLHGQSYYYQLTYGPEQALSVEQALHAYTVGGAYASFEEDVKGSISPGRYADFVVLSADPRDVTELYRVGTNSYVVKPRDFEELRRALDTLQEYWFRVVELPTAS